MQVYGPTVKASFFKDLADGYPSNQAAKRNGISAGTATNWLRKKKADDPVFARTFRGRGHAFGKEVEEKFDLPGDHPLTDPAKRALDDFAYFRHRYLGRHSTPWQTEAAVRILDYVTSGDTEFVVINAPPGSGKSTLFVNDVPLWLICRDRTIRILIGSSTAKLAAQYTNRIRRMLERPRPLPAAKDREAAEGCLAADYGRFKPDTGADIWRREEFTVVSISDELSDNMIEDKEPTVSSYGMDSEFLGARANLVIWDDLVTNRTLKNVETIESQRTWWSNEAETRVEPGGALILQGQRMGPEDLYRYALDQRLGDDDVDQARYRHIIYPAHFEDRCHNVHGLDSPAYPTGCLLDPHRLPWRGSNGLLTHQRNRVDKYRVQYQQEDTDPGTVLVPAIWINGGRDVDGVEYPGCWDNHRDFANTPADIPHGLSAPTYSIATVDPSPTMYWAIQWWLYHPASEQRFLLDLIRQKMEAPTFLDWNATDTNFYGIMDDWQQRSVRLGFPITHWIVEHNAAQRFMLQYDHVKRWQRLHSVTIIGHNTIANNKLDPDYGIQMLRDKYRFGNVRLPGKHGNWSAARPVVESTLVKELTHYSTDGTRTTSTDDCLMSQWFFEHHVPRISRPIHKQARPLHRPSWMRKAS